MFIPALSFRKWQRYRKKNETTCLRNAINLVDKQIEWTEKQLLAEQAAAQSPAKLQWTGSVAEWVELIYALYATGYINNGKASLKELFHIMGMVFDFEVREYANYFMNIKNRKDGNRTRFLDLMKRLLLGRMTEADRKPLRK